ncbi:polysaccharide deacetylase family protein [Algoriphagus aquimarinus]|uniref:Peptidoglycan/xylan/chitin deacetylase, PgdA/CDA1 family n=1 Tax=Algoriphagus aquimarinus TaxID=237018 RepID=A0A1I0XZI2_9BACT|nr:polysaccharide deacetylase family protein [Algoriphagus aquimarinus]SFB06382.1 Peptidoglycan/xylan/chitin deacetylase, PgdA/CDA1 family [Algoriphagus aquimarinus]
MSKTQGIFGIAILGAIAILLTSISNYYLIALFVGVSFFLFGMSMFLRAQFFVKSTFRTSENNVLLSFDDGPDPVNTPLVLDILKKQGATAMFFLIGKKVKGNEALVRRIQEEGHLLGSHSYSHDSKIGLWNKARTTMDIRTGHEELLKVVPNAGDWYRPPFGVTNPTIASALKKCGLKSIGWSVRSFDTVKKDPKKLLENLSQEIKGSDIVLLHDTQNLTVSILEPLVLELKSRKLTLKAELN